MEVKRLSALSRTISSWLAQARLGLLPALLRARVPHLAVAADVGTLGEGRRYRRDMILMPRDAPGSIACGRSGLPMLAVCPSGHRRTVPFRLLKTSEDDRTPLYGRPFKCKACGSPEVVLFAVESQAELDKVRASLPSRDVAQAPTTHRPLDPRANFV